MKFPLFTFVLASMVVLANCAKNNVCPTIADYYTLADNPNCWYDFSAEGNATEIIKYFGYPVEFHRVTTDDGYILTMFRIPNTNSSIKRGPIFILTGVLMSGASFLAKGKDSLAFLLSDAGYDVWLGNYRGDEYSEGHVNLTVYDKRYWDYSSDEIGIYDVPAFIEYIAQTTGERGNIVYIGYSLGTFVAMMYGSEYPEAAKTNIKLFILLGPLTSANHMISPVRLVTPFFPLMLDIFNRFDLIRIVSHGATQKQLFKLICFESPKLMDICHKFVNSIMGWRGQAYPDMFTIGANQLPAGISFKVFAQVTYFIDGAFAKYDYGRKNILKYGTIKPPVYNFTKLDVPVYLVYSVSDWLCGKKDSLVFYSKLSAKGQSLGRLEIGVPNFNHADFAFGRHAKALVYDPILQLLSRI